MTHNFPDSILRLSQSRLFIKTRQIALLKDQKSVHFKIIGDIHNIETIASGRGIKELRRLNRVYGRTTWRKCKGLARIKIADGSVMLAELHWYEGHGKGKQEFKIKRYVE